LDTAKHLENEELDQALKFAVREALIDLAKQQPRPIEFLVQSRAELISLLVLGASSRDAADDGVFRAQIVQAFRDVWQDVFDTFEERKA